jgi:hypothetical protein
MAIGAFPWPSQLSLHQGEAVSVSRSVVMEEVGEWLISPRRVVARRADPQFFMMALTADTDGYLHHTAEAL